MGKRLRKDMLLIVLPCTAVAGCIFGGGGRKPAIISSDDPGSKIPAIKHAVDVRDTQTARQLVRSLESDDPAVRFYAIRGLQSLTGETFGYVWYLDTDPQRRASLEKWKKWLDANEDSLAAGEHNRK